MNLKPFLGVDWIQYPNTSRKITTSYDPQGRAISVSGQISGGAPTNYASSIGYWPQGAIHTMTQGNGLVTTTQYNSRLQPVSIQAGSLLSIVNRYDPNPSADLNCSGASTTVPGNNGNVLGQTINGVGRIYSYDGVSRLCRARQGATWTESYAYDTRGNIGVTRSGALPAVTAEVIGSTGAYAANNRVSAWAYDQAGNVTGIPAAGGSTVRATCAAGTMAGTAMLRTACYDAENRMVSETDANGATSTYAYDGDGRRMSKTVGGVTTTFVYDPMGQLAQEYGGPAIPGAEAGTRYLTTDQLGSTRLVTDGSGNAAQAYDYLPFGQDFTLPTDSNRIRFTSKERDAETGLDFFGARYLSSAQGRFTTADPSMLSVVMADPQSWNRYLYALNNPLRYIDPDGECWVAAPSGTGTYDWQKQALPGQTCVDAVATNNGKGVTVYGSSGASDITRYNANGKDLVDVVAMSGHHDAQFISRQTPGQEENYLRSSLAASLFNVSFGYHAEYSGDSKLVFTGGTTATGESVLYQSGPRQGQAIHPGHDWSIDLRYMDASGRPSTAAQADAERMKVLIGLFQSSGLRFAITGIPSNFGFGPTSAQYRSDHASHLHVQPAPRRIELQIKPGQR